MRVELRQVRKVHRLHGGGTVTPVDGVDLTLEPGSFTLLRGPSGSGKSSLLALIGGFSSPTSGTVTHEGVAPANGSRLAATVSWVMQEPIFIPELTVMENLFLPAVGRGGEWPSERGGRLMRVFGLEELFDLLPSALSGGEKRRLSLARGLLMPARLLLLDEPLAYLDDVWGERVMALVREFVGGGTTLVVATHQEIPGAGEGRVVRMERGRTG